VVTQLVKQSPSAPASVPPASTPPASSGAASPGAVAAPSVAAAPTIATAPPPPVAPAAPAGSATPTAVAPAPAAAPTTAAAVAAARGLAAPYRLIARTTETTWMRVRTEDGRTSEETIPANEIREWISNSPFVLTIGNAGGVSLELNGRILPRLGSSGAVITRLVLPSDTQ
jgi:cytoskeleton protein RodZ